MIYRGILILILITGGYSSIVTAQELHVAIVKNASGNVEILRNKTSLSATLGMQLMRLDKIITGRGSHAGITFVDGTLVTVGSSTEIELRKYLFEPKKSNYDFELYVKKGTAVYSSGKLGKLAPEAVNLATPRATVGVHGTRLIIKVD